jgi:hypothetical protein
VSKRKLLILSILCGLLAFVVAALAPAANAQENRAYVTGVRFDDSGGINTATPEEESTEVIVVVGHRRVDPSRYPASGPERIEDSSFGPTTIIYRRRLAGPLVAQTEAMEESIEPYDGPTFTNRVPRLGLVFPTPLFGPRVGASEDE